MLRVVARARLPHTQAQLNLATSLQIQIHACHQKRYAHAPSPAQVQYHASMPDIVDDKSPHVIPFILSCLDAHRRSSSSSTPPAPFFIGLNGVQGIGKTTLVTSLAAALREPPHNLATLTLSIDDFYLPRDRQATLAASDPTNPLIQHRGQPSTHDVGLALQVLRALRAREHDIHVPAYDKGAYGGKGDRMPEDQWRVVNKENEAPIEVVIFEGWCVGFRAVDDSEVEARWQRAQKGLADEQEAEKPPSSQGRLQAQPLHALKFVNSSLRNDGYEELFADILDAFVHLDATATAYVYAWRREQEDQLRAERGESNAMSDEEVIAFVDGYYPAYELFGDRVRQGVFRDKEGSQGRQIRLAIARDRSVQSAEVV